MTRTRNCLLDILATIIVLPGYACIAFAYLGPKVPFERGRLHDLAWYATFMARTFDYHIGLVYAIIAILALLLRRFRLALAALPLFLIGVGPTLQSLKAIQSDDEKSGLFRVMTANLLWVNRQTDLILNEILREDPDLVFLQEYTPTWDVAAKRALSVKYPFSFAQPAEQAFGAAIYSKNPISDAIRFPGFPPGNRSPFLRANLNLASGEVKIYCVHMVPPTWSNRALFLDQFAALYSELKKQDGPTIVGGDFNFTNRASMANLLTSFGLSEAQSMAGHGRGGTFKIPFLPNIAIDHVYSSRQFAPISCRTGIGEGSDHRPLIVDLHRK
ncbi:MAG: endonuclease/exonuclease/phosphatase family protein [Planctomycetes bacterium]|nr:endonuclease/exonuclease/phosphatase family protein [Planctomycetota bacterium]MBI3835767.1 endonuclease/exonuclease/phosphatase family protein [Planctomycetota bacterium]